MGHMMPETIFYAWQSDHPSNVNKNFIRDAIERAIEALNAEIGVENALREDQDTEGVPGDINVAEVIFDKIDRCRIFVADITTITPDGANRPSPNPNVLVEYGRASVRPGSDRVVTIFNEAYGNWEKDRPFDLRHRRRPVLYKLLAEHTPVERKLARQALVSQLVAVFRETLKVAPQSVSIPDVTSFESLRARYKETTFPDNKTGRIIGFWCGLIPVAQTIRLERLWDRTELLTRTPAISITSGNSPLPLRTIDAHLFGTEPVVNTPIQNGVRCVKNYCYSRNHSARGQNEDVVAVYGYEDGRVALVVRTDNLAPAPYLNLGWIIADVANALQILHRVRCAAKSPRATYVLLVELRYDDQWLENLEPVRGDEWRLCTFDDESGRTGPLIKSEPLVIGPIRVEAPENFSNVLEDVYTKTITSAGRRPEDGLDFKTAINPESLSVIH